MPPLTMKELGAAYASGRNHALEEAGRLCDTEAQACIGDIQPGDEIGKREANARAGALLTAAADIRKLIASTT